MTSGLAFAVLMLLGSATGALACTVSEGDIVTMLYDDPPKPGVVTKVSPAGAGETCIVEYRILVAPGDPSFDPFSSGMFDDLLVPYDGPVANTNPYGCPYGPGQNADYNSEAGWRPAIINDSDASCSYEIDYYEGALANPVKVSNYDFALLRPAKLAKPSADEQQAAARCTVGGRYEDYNDGSDDSAFRRLIINEVIGREKQDVSVYFDRIRYGRTSIVVDGGTFSAKNPDAAIGTEFVPVRIDARVCKDSSGRPETVSHVYDYNCFTDKFGDFACRLEASR